MENRNVWNVLVRKICLRIGDALNANGYLKSDGFFRVRLVACGYSQNSAKHLKHCQKRDFRTLPHWHS